MNNVKDHDETKSVINRKLLERFNQHFDKVRGTGIQMAVNDKQQMIVNLDDPILRTMFDFHSPNLNNK